MFWQAGLAVVTIILTVVLVFAMTSAWYTNIVQTSGLTFEAEPWGFSGEIVVNTDPIVAGPGDEGVVHLEVTNTNDSITAVGVNVSKVRMDKQMQQRLFFYVDTQQTRNNEVMERVYLNNQDSYSYTLFSQGKLTLTETVHNDAQLKRHWVYDVLGYYVYGTEIVDEKGIRTVNVQEYLRPIEYNYDDATTTFTTDEAGVVTMELKTVDGKTTVDEFMVEFSKKDGYEGVIDPEAKLESGYYPVAVEESNGSQYGVYAYLCTYSEIEMATQFDTYLGEQAIAGQHPDIPAVLSVTAQKNKNSEVTVNSLTGLETAINMGTADVIQLSDNIAFTGDDVLVLSQGQRAMLDLNGHTITTEGGKPAIIAGEGSSLTVTNGSIVNGVTENDHAIQAIGAELVLSDVNISGYKTGLRVEDDKGTLALDSTVRLIKTTITADNYGVFVKGNGSVSGQATQLIIENSTIKGKVYGLTGSGNENQSGTDVQILNSQIICEGDQVSVGIYHPQRNSKLTVYNSAVQAYTAMVIKGGDVSVMNSEVTGTGVRQEPVFSGSGSADTGDAIYIETNYNTPISLEIGGNSKIESNYSYSLQVFEPDATNVKVRIYSGVFDEEQPNAYLAKDSVQTHNNGKFEITEPEPTEENTQTDEPAT